MLSKENSKSAIIDNFHKNVLGKYPQNSEPKSKHEGTIGHWLEANLGGGIDSDGDADLNGYECKIDSAKTSWGDWGVGRFFLRTEGKLISLNSLSSDQ
jgi:hypothetical protein